MPAGSLQQWTLTLTAPTPSSDPPYPVDGLTWEYAARTSPADLTVPPLVKITTVSSAAGLITVTSTPSVSSLLLAIYPAATSALAPGTYYHSLWADPGTAQQVPLFGGLLLIDGAPQP
jgi:hypothetical protein